MDVTGDVAYAMVAASAKEANETWPPKGEHWMPTLCCEEEFCQYIDVAVAAFRARISRDQLNAWSARLQQEIARAGPGPKTAAWCHLADEPKPDGFDFGPMTGTAAELNRWIVGATDPNARQLHARGRRGRAWIVRRDRTTYQVWFKTQGEIDSAKHRAAAAKTPVAKKKARRQ
jgi:hypothetical protein